MEQKNANNSSPTLMQQQYDQPIDQNRQHILSSPGFLNNNNNNNNNNISQMNSNFVAPPVSSFSNGTNSRAGTPASMLTQQESIDTVGNIRDSTGWKKPKATRGGGRKRSPVQSNPPPCPQDGKKRVDWS